jgi:N-carbamoylputrescine amidase
VATTRNPVLGLIQSSTSADKQANVEKAVAGIREAAKRGANIVCLQELFASPYFCQVEDAALFDLAEPIPGPTSDAVAKAAKDAKVTVVSSVFEKRTAGVYHNTAVVYGPDGAELARYRKMHIPDDPQYYEKFYFTPGDLGFVAVPTPNAVVGTLVCWDQWYPEAARLTALRGAEILCYPTAIGWLPRDKAEYGEAQRAAWQTIQRSHAIANGVFVVAVNRVGVESSREGDIEFWGHSFVVDPGGTIIAQAGAGEEILVVECDLSKIEATRRGWPFLRDRRIDAFSDLSRRWIGREGDR